MSPASAGAAPVDAGEMQARVDAAVVQARRHVFRRRLIPLLVVAAIAVGATGVGLLRDGTSPSPAPVARFLLALPEARRNQLSGRWLALSPSGDELAFTTGSQLMLRRLSNFEAAPVSQVLSRSPPAHQ